MFARIRHYVVAAGAAAAISTGAFAPRPASADTTSTVNTILGAAAVVGGIVLYNNYQHKKQEAQAERYGYGRDQRYAGDRNGYNRDRDDEGGHGNTWSHDRGR
jgi:hypothetical protein